MNTIEKFWTECDRTRKEEETAYNIYIQYDESDDPYSDEALSAYRTWLKASEEHRRAYDAYDKAVRKELGRQK